MQEQIRALEKNRTARMAKADAIGGFMARLQNQNQPLPHFDSRLWLEVIDHVEVHRDGTMSFVFQNESVICV